MMPDQKQGFGIARFSDQANKRVRTGVVDSFLARHARRLCEFGRNTRQSLLGANGRGSEHKVGQETMADDISADRLRVGTSPRGELAVAVALAGPRGRGLGVASPR